MVIYLIHNKLDGKYYVGKTVKPLNIRWSAHVSAANHGSQTYLHRAMRKYGAENFVISPLMSTLTSDADLKKWERELIAMFRANDPNHGYNQTEGGDGRSGGEVSEETRRKISEKHSGRPRKPHSEETKRKISMSETGKVESAETRRRKSVARKGVGIPHEVRDKISTAHRKNELPRGVTFTNGGAQFNARIMKNGKRVYLGSFATAEQASHAYEEAFRTI